MKGLRRAYNAAWEQVQPSLDALGSVLGAAATTARDGATTGGDRLGAFEGTTRVWEDAHDDPLDLSARGWAYAYDVCTNEELEAIGMNPLWKPSSSQEPGTGPSSSDAFG
jgi:hypothetical protein